MTTDEPAPVTSRQSAGSAPESDGVISRHTKRHFSSKTILDTLDTGLTNLNFVDHFMLSIEF